MPRISNNDNNSGELKNEETMMEDDEFKDDVNKLNVQLNDKILENENYQQEIYELRQKLKACLATQKDLSDVNETLEENFNREKLTSDRKINNLLEKFSGEKKTYEKRLSELESSLSLEEKKNEELRETLAAKDKLLNVTSKSDDLDNGREILILKNQICSLTEELKERIDIEDEFIATQRQLEENLTTLQKNYNEIEEILQLKKEDLASLKDTLEITRNELAVCRSELESLKAIPASDSAKGNSLFAEVEDSRQKMIQDMTSMRKKYLQMKQTYDGKENELRSLKAERAMLLRKWEDDKVDNVNQSGKLIEMYKSRISELESRLKMEEKKLKMKEDEDGKKQPAESNFSYLQSLLNAKKKEIEELHKKLSANSAEKILQEEIKYDISMQLRQWRCKAMSYKAQLIAMGNETEYENYPMIKSNDSGDNGDEFSKNDDDSCDLKIAENILAARNRSEYTLEKLLKIPTTASLEDKKTSGDDFFAINDDDDDESKKKEPPVKIVESQKATTILKEDIKSCAKPFTAGKKSNLIFTDPDDKENSASASIDIKSTTLKSALLNSKVEKSRSNGREKIKKNLRFTPDTVVNDSQKPKLTRQKITKEAYPFVFISNQVIKK